MKKTILLLFAIVFLIFSFTSCMQGYGRSFYFLPNQMNDQFVYFLPNDYWLHYYGRANVCIEIKINDKVDPHRILDGKYIVKFFIDGDYVGTKSVVENKGDDNWWKKIYKADEENVPYEYYISDTKNEISYGPFSESVFFDECFKREITKYEWINISPTPEGAVYCCDLTNN